MKIVFIDPQSYSNLEQYDINLLSSNKSNKENKVIFLGNSKFLSRQSISFYFIPLYWYSNHKSKFIKLLSYGISSILAFIIILIKNPKVIHVQWIKVWQIDFFLLKLLNLIGKYKIIYTAHNILPHDTGRKYYKSYKKYYHIVDKIICHSFSTKNELSKLFNINPEKIEVIPHGIFQSKAFEDENLIAELKAKYNLKTQLIFSVLGKQSYYKGSDLVADVWYKTPILHDNSKYKLLIVGQNTTMDFSQLKLMSNVIIDNRYVTSDEFSLILKLSSVLLLPYRAISQSGVLFSALGDKVPFLVSNVGGLQEPLDLSDLGWNIGEPTFENLQKTLIKIVKNPEELHSKKNNHPGWEKVQNYYSWKTISDSTFELYRNVIE